MNNTSIDELHSLVRLLAANARVKRVAATGRPEDEQDVATEAAAGLLDVQRSTAVLFGELLPQLRAADPASSRFDEILDQIAEEYRHIHYHITKTRLFDYIIPPT